MYWIIRFTDIIIYSLSGVYITNGYVIQINHSENNRKKHIN